MFFLFKKIKILFQRFLQKIPSSTLQIIDIDGSPGGKNTKIRYQVCGKSITNKDTPEKLLHDLFQVKGFSSEDSDLILALYNAEKNSPNFKIKNILFSDAGEEFKVEDLKNGFTLTMTPDSIFESNELVQQFTYTDILILYHCLVNNKTRNEKKSIKMKKLTTAPSFYVVKNEK